MAKVWFNWVLTPLGWLIVGLCIYTLSFGPVLKLCGARRGGRWTAWTALPAWVQIVYGPLTTLPAGPLTRFLDTYLQWWMPLDD